MHHALGPKTEVGVTSIHHGGVAPIDERLLSTVEAYLAAASGQKWAVAESDSPGVLVRLVGGSDRVMRVTRGFEPASAGDVHFIAHARRDLQRLVDDIRGKATLSAPDLDAIAQRCRQASPGPWTAFIESEGEPGCDAIRVSELDSEPDLYLWFDDSLAPSADYRLVAAARQYIPAMLDQLQTGHHSKP
jgi:hypothetical protein